MDQSNLIGLTLNKKFVSYASTIVKGFIYNCENISEERYDNVRFVEHNVVRVPI